MCSAHLQVGSEEERIVPGDLIPAQVICQEEDDVRPGLGTTLPCGERERVITRSQCSADQWPPEPVNINTTSTNMVGNMMSPLDDTVLMSVATTN